MKTYRWYVLLSGHSEYRNTMFRDAYHGKHMLTLHRGWAEIEERQRQMVVNPERLTLSIL